MRIAVVTGSAGLVGSTAVLRFTSEHDLVLGIDNDMRGQLFGPSGSVVDKVAMLEEKLSGQYEHHSVDVRDRGKVDEIFRKYSTDISTVLHAAAQPSHDWAAKEPATDFSINAGGTFNLLEATRRHASDATFAYLSTSKVYGDRPNRLPFVDMGSRWDLPAGHPQYSGIDESFGVDQCVHSLFGTSKLSADLFVQEYGRYFSLTTGVFRAGCVTGARHAGVEQHGFLSHLVRTILNGRTYTIFGYQGKQLRDNIHADDLVRAIQAYSAMPKPGKVYNIGGGRRCNCSVKEALSYVEKIASISADTSYRERHRKGDHRWYITDCTKFREDYPSWTPQYELEEIMKELIEDAFEDGEGGRHRS